MNNAFEARGVFTVAVAQEDTALESHGRFLEHFDNDPNFEIVADINRAVTTDYKRTTTYLIDREGVVRQVFPGLIHFRGSWHAVLSEIDRLGMAKTDAGGSE